MNFNLLDIFKILYRNRRIIIGITGIAALGSIVISLLKPDFYRGETTFYAASQDLAMPEKIFGLTNSPMEYYGSDEETDRLLAAASSNELFNAVIDQFDLVSYYNIDPEHPEARLKAHKRFKKNFSVQKNKLDAMELFVEDEDPEMAAKMANETRDILNSITADFIRTSQSDVLKGLKRDIVRKNLILDTLSSDLSSLKEKFGIIDPEQQAELLSKKYLMIEASVATSKAKLEALKDMNMSRQAKADSTRKYRFIYEANTKLLDQLKIDSVGLNVNRFNTGINLVNSMETYYTNLKNQIARDQVWYQQLENAMNSDFPALLVIQRASVPERKSRPRRSLIVIGATLGAFVFSLLGVLLQHSVNAMDWSAIKS